ncbi:MAG: S9 family peptidase [Ignavibacteriae bacterium]|nr:S9 family peptidase [Ignavibacteria bacterium]MBI3365393.1 S9 family peptidase [Ignavibacteriota bacterium]
MKTIISAFFVLLITTSQLFGQSPPVARMIPKADTLHGDIRVDNYYWLRERKSPEVLKYLEAENAYTDAAMKPTVALQETLYNEMVRRIKETDQDPPYPEGSYYYYTRTEKGKQYPIYCRKKGSADAPEEIYFDQNEMAKGSRFYRLWHIDVSTDGNLLAYSIDTSGSENYVLHVKNLIDGAILSDQVENTQGITWAADNQTIFYTMEDSAKRPYRVYRHTVGTTATDDQLVYEEKDALFTVGIDRTRSNKYILLGSSAFNSSEWRYVPAATPAAEFRIIAPRRPEHEYDVDHWGDYFYIRTNNNAKTFRLARAPVADPGEKNWEEVIPYRKEVTIEGMDFFSNHSIVYEREKGLQKVRVTDMRTNAVQYIEFPEPVYTVFPNVNRVFATNIFRYSYQSLTRPASIFDYNLDTKEQKLVKQQEVLGGYDPSQYRSERIFAKAEDGADIPISLVYKKGVPMDGTAPLHLTGYGAYGSSSQPTFSSTRLSYLDRGVIYAIAHVRGGGDMGREWYDNGKLLHKKNTFTDFIACAEHLLDKEYTGKDRLTISGGSAGGLLMGAVTTMRPDLFKAVIAAVPFVDALNTMLDPTLMYTEQEYLEWGNPHQKMYYDYMKSYDPYTNVKAINYPNILVRVGFNDPRVNYWEGTKWVARLRALKTDNNTILLKVNMGQGHMGSTGRYERLKEAAFDYAYILTQSGITK